MINEPTAFTEIKSEDMSKEVSIENVLIDNEIFYKISNSDAMRPFFMSIVSDSNHWMFISSNGGLSAGRKNSEFSLFPYYTDDKITEMAEFTGSKSIFNVKTNSDSKIWEPFSTRYAHKYRTSRNLYKNSYGNKIIFEEVNHDLELTFRYQWNSSTSYGFIKRSTLMNNSNDKVQVDVLDGIQNVLPYGVNSDLQTRVSNLVDAYKRTELDKTSGIGIFALSAIIVDKAEPSEALKANVAWSLGLEDPKYLLSSLQLDAFRAGNSVKEEYDIKAEKGAYFINEEMSIAPGANNEWMIVANVNQDHASIAELSSNIQNNDGLASLVKSDIEKGTERLINLVASSDGLQLTADTLRDTRHFSNTLFNIMRGGIFDNNYQIEKWDFNKYLANANKEVFKEFESVLESLPEEFSQADLKALAAQHTNADFSRLCIEYMPLKFSRRHGDPSRPWNRFSINTRSEIDGSKILDYEGNWRDIFQNWEALAHAYPEYMDSMIHKFLNATTFDGYNPYRITKGGFDWEVIEEHDPWSYIGYWGDHQIIYLLKFLEFIQDHAPGKLEAYFSQDLFVYANVPYKIKSYQETLQNPKDTIDFDYDDQAMIEQERERMGVDGALLKDQSNTIYHVNFLEKILATVLAKVSNFIPEGGIWMNTQRPEWNDANNALVGNGVSMVTLCYLRRFMNFTKGIIEDASLTEAHISEELHQFFKSVVETLDANSDLLVSKFSDSERKKVLDGVGEAGSHFRMTVYKDGFSGNKKEVSLGEIQHFMEITLRYLDHSIDANRRSDDLYHAYNIMTVNKDNSVSISYLDEMLEGQVAVLSSGYISSAQCLKVLDGMKKSKLFRDDQYSYLLYPNKELPGFLSKNNIPAESVERSKLLTKLVDDGNLQIINKDTNGTYHFNGNFNNANSLKVALDGLKDSSFGNLVDQDRDLVLQIFEEVFNHKAFTGRSGTFYGYEGLGSIYWHMVSKLQLAVMECCVKAVNDQESEELIGRLLEHYYEINEGIGVHKSPTLYGAFPTDPYSHTPAGKGAQQPGMTGQVKEDILSRIGELGVFVRNGVIEFNPCLLRADEFLNRSTTYHFVNVNNEKDNISLNENELAFSYCQIPVVYKLTDLIGIKVIYNNDEVELFEELAISESISSKIFNRSGDIKKIEVSITNQICR